MSKIKDANELIQLVQLKFSPSAPTPILVLKKYQNEMISVYESMKIEQTDSAFDKKQREIIFEKIKQFEKAIKILEIPLQY